MLVLNLLIKKRDSRKKNQVTWVLLKWILTINWTNEPCMLVGLTCIHHFLLFSSVLFVSSEIRFCSKMFPLSRVLSRRLDLRYHTHREIIHGLGLEQYKDCNQAHKIRRNNDAVSHDSSIWSKPRHHAQPHSWRFQSKQARYRWTHRKTPFEQKRETSWWPWNIHLILDLAESNGLEKFIK